MVTGSSLSHVAATMVGATYRTAAMPVVQFLIRQPPERTQHRQQDQRFVAIDPRHQNALGMAISTDMLTSPAVQAT
jgi:hypothetical protein